MNKIKTKRKSLKRTVRVRNVLIGLMIAFIGLHLFTVFDGLKLGQVNGIGEYFLNKDLSDTASANVVTAIVVNYRGFDTLGEVTVLFLAATGLGAILSGERKIRRVKTHANFMIRVAAKSLLSFILLFGAYIFIHGHLSPGGGFQGGVIVATGFLLLFMSYRSFDVHEKSVKWTESLAGLTFVGIGLAGLIIAGSFLQNVMPVGTPGHLFSAGVIPLIYIAVGFKVGAELTGLLKHMMGIVE